MCQQTHSSPPSTPAALVSLQVQCPGVTQLHSRQPCLTTAWLATHADTTALAAQVINNLKSLVGVRIRVSNREDYFPGTKDRKVTISGSAEAVQIAQALIAQKIAAAGPAQ